MTSPISSTTSVFSPVNFPKRDLVNSSRSKLVMSGFPPRTLLSLVSGSPSFSGRKILSLSYKVTQYEGHLESNAHSSI